MTRESGSALGLLVIAAVVALLHSGCGSSAALATPVQTIPQHVSLTLHASDGGTITVGGACYPGGEESASATRVERAATERTPATVTTAPTPTVRGDCGGGSVWLDARGGGAGSETQQSGTEIDTTIDAAASVAASGSGSATGGPASTGSR